MSDNFNNWWLATHLASRLTYVIEQHRKNGRLIVTRLPAIASELINEHVIEWRKVPLDIRRAYRQANPEWSRHHINEHVIEWRKVPLDIRRAYRQANPEWSRHHLKRTTP